MNKDGVSKVEQITTTRRDSTEWTISTKSDIFLANYEQADKSHGWEQASKQASKQQLANRLVALLERDDLFLQLHDLVVLLLLIAVDLRASRLLFLQTLWYIRHPYAYASSLGPRDKIAHQETTSTRHVDSR